MHFYAARSNASVVFGNAFKSQHHQHQAFLFSPTLEERIYFCLAPRNPSVQNPSENDPYARGTLCFYFGGGVGGGENEIDDAFTTGKSETETWPSNAANDNLLSIFFFSSKPPTPFCWEGEGKPILEACRDMRKEGWGWGENLPAPPLWPPRLERYVSFYKATLYSVDVPCRRSNRRLFGGRTGLGEQWLR